MSTSMHPEAAEEELDRRDFEESEPEIYGHPCPACDGTGFDSYEMGKCIICDGTGRV